MAALLKDYFDTTHLISTVHPATLAAPKRLSPKQLAAQGWTRHDTRMVGASFTHPSGWSVEHCGHPTAIYPWALYSPEGRMVRAYNGHAWHHAAEAFTFVGLVLAAA